MPSFHNGAVEIAYLDEGEGDPIVLVHGFASSKNVNWIYPTWVSDLKKDGRRVIALYNRGHGDPKSSTISRDYEIAIMASDVIALLDHLGIERADVMGYSLGSRMTAILAREQPQRLRSAILGGIGIGLIQGVAPARAWPSRSKCRRWKTSPIRSGGRFAPSPIRPAPTAARLLPAFAVRVG